MHDRVRSQHEELKQIAASFGREAEATARSLAQLRRQKDVLQGGDWLGQAARKFYDEMDGSLLPALTRLQRALT
ncbi:MAG: WXG100 family type VII secretion target, partial [Anaerolineales bacterium]|nr:WXG100 family type VII secretion target [Anaerolineales bacterium]